MMLAGEIFKQWNENGGAFVPTFDSPSQIPSGVDLGPAISVAGETWYWSTTRNRYIPGEKVSKATYADLTTLATQMGLGNNAASIGIKVWLVNSLSPEGMTRMYWTGTLWAPVAGQTLAYERAAGSGYLLDMFASGLTPGIGYDIYVGPDLPSWFWADGRAFYGVVDAAFLNASSTTNVTMSARFSDASSSSVLGCISGRSAAAATTENKLPHAPTAFSQRGNALFGSAGNNPASGGSQNYQSGSVASTAKFRLNAICGATTDEYRLRSWALISGQF